MPKGDKARHIAKGISGLELEISGIGKVSTTVDGAKHSLMVGHFPPKDILLNSPTHLAAVLKRSSIREEVPQNEKFDKIWRLKSKVKVNGERFHFKAVIGRFADGFNELHQVYLGKRIK